MLSREGMSSVPAPLGCRAATGPQIARNRSMEPEELAVIACAVSQAASAFALEYEASLPILLKLHFVDWPAGTMQV